MDVHRIDRRHFLKISGSAAGVASTGIAGMLAAHQAPAWAQGTKLHIVRWVDFIPEADVELKRRLGSQQGARRGSRLRVHQCQRPSAAHHGPPSSPARAPTSSRCSGTGRISTRTGSSTSPTWPPDRPPPPPSATASSPSRTPSSATPWLALWSTDRRQGVSEDLGRVPRGRQETQSQGQADRSGARPQLRRSRRSRIRSCGTSAAPRPTRAARRSRSTRRAPSSP